MLFFRVAVLKKRQARFLYCVLKFESCVNKLKILG